MSLPGAHPRAYEPNSPIFRTPIARSSAACRRKRQDAVACPLSWPALYHTLPSSTQHGRLFQSCNNNVPFAVFLILQ
jgi:hypothetical protein